MDYVPTSLLLPGSFLLTALLTLTPAEPRPLEFRVVPEPATSRIAAPSFLMEPCTGCAAESLTGIPTPAVQVVEDPAWNNGQCSGTRPHCTPKACDLGGAIKIQNVSGGIVIFTWELGGEEGTVETLDQEHFYKNLAGKSVNCDKEFKVSFNDTQGLLLGTYVLKCSRCPD